MKKLLLIICTLLLGIALTTPAMSAQVGKPLKDFVLPGPDAGQAAYLGIPENEPFTVSQIQAKCVIIQIFSMYCPYCQAEAKPVNEMFAKLKASPQGKDLKLIGVGAGNSKFEVEFFRDKYGIDFPLFDDADFAIHTCVGDVGTPFYILAKPGADDMLEVLYTHQGAVKDRDAFLNTLTKKAGLD